MRMTEFAIFYLDSCGIQHLEIVKAMDDKNAVDKFNKKSHKCGTVTIINILK